ncbi:hypothetical protein [Mycobacterium sp. 236(2023)]|uniref:hypothetical protein n=1 Tax=Mycobacterium sp. 236(2023) TaxID=3038163 RepID=UPI00241587B6|nr:hypothetical protein [Mycobacterium sp. 236(2023)]MDG4667284.1 hypothetical protein [Mycobacterium sp. 236(2023)]
MDGPLGTYGFAPRPAPPPPSGVTAALAIILAGLGALACLGSGLLGILGLIGLSAPGSTSGFRTSAGIAGDLFPVLVFGVALNFVSGVLLTVGTVQLARRRLNGRGLIVGGCGVTIGSALLSLGYAASSTTPYGAFGGDGLEIVSFIFPVATLMLVLVPPTTAWLTARRNPPEFS